MHDKAQELLNRPNQNKYHLVLEVARRAKQLKDEAGAYNAPEASKPIKTALEELAERHRAEDEGAAAAGLE